MERFLTCAWSPARQAPKQSNVLQAEVEVLRLYAAMDAPV